MKKLIENAALARTRGASFRRAFGALKRAKRLRFFNENQV
ncbi:hypothetical protein HMPREF7215_2071 [Pyramidobacter piscolens W5455]|uniref:50S ribosomal protein L20 n=1 Tax=Pyramidobacter piscolens W5455 TaxID=352165 RepID=A0ABM9ZTK4_9BACT|nr:hypothetical protein HMPREF7215_2071 [Pyramidobacter piscolens W5455]